MFCRICCTRSFFSSCGKIPYVSLKPALWNIFYRIENTGTPISKMIVVKRWTTTPHNSKSKIIQRRRTLKNAWIINLLLLETIYNIPSHLLHDLHFRDNLALLLKYYWQGSFLTIGWPWCECYCEGWTPWRTWRRGRNLLLRTGNQRPFKMVATIGRIIELPFSSWLFGRTLFIRTGTQRPFK